MTQGAWANLFFTASIGLSATSLALLVAWLRARERAIRAELRLEGRAGMAAAPVRGAATGELDSIAEEVQRLGEGHEFVMELLKQRRLPGASGEASAPARSTRDGVSTV